MAMANMTRTRPVVTDTVSRCDMRPNDPDFPAVLPTRASAVRRAGSTEERKTGPVTAPNRPQSDFVDGAMALRFGTCWLHVLY
jgi:hypothetical protein